MWIIIWLCTVDDGAVEAMMRGGANFAKTTPTVAKELTCAGVWC